MSSAPAATSSRSSHHAHTDATGMPGPSAVIARSRVGSDSSVRTDGTAAAAAAAASTATPMATASATASSTVDAAVAVQAAVTSTSTPTSLPNNGEKPSTGWLGRFFQMNGGGGGGGAVGGSSSSSAGPAPGTMPGVVGFPAVSSTSSPSPLASPPVPYPAPAVRVGSGSSVEGMPISSGNTLQVPVPVRGGPGSHGTSREPSPSNWGAVTVNSGLSIVMTQRPASPALGITSAPSLASAQSVLPPSTLNHLPVLLGHERAEMVIEGQSVYVEIDGRRIPMFEGGDTGSKQVAMLEKVFGAARELATKAWGDLWTRPAERKCCICMEPFSFADGIECLADEDDHFVCGLCLNSYIETACAPGTMSMVQEDASLPCPGYRCTGERCTAGFSSQALAKVASPEAFSAYWDYRNRLAEERIAAEMEAALKERADAEARRSETSKQRLLIAELMTMKCPRCGQAFSEFQDCFALRCPRPQCNAGFCGWCLKDCGVDAHRHICGECHIAKRISPYNPLWGDAKSFEAAHRERRQKLLSDHLATLDPGLREDVVKAIRPDLEGWGLSNNPEHPLRPGGPVPRPGQQQIPGGRAPQQFGMPGQPQIRHGPPQVVVGGAPQRIVVGPGGMPQLQAQPQPQPQVQAGQAGQAARFFPVNRGPAVGGATAPANSPTASVGGVIEKSTTSSRAWIWWVMKREYRKMTCGPGSPKASHKIFDGLVKKELGRREATATSTIDANMAGSSVQGLPAPSACASSPSAGGTASPTVAAATASPSFSSSTKVTAPAPQAPAPAAAVGRPSLPIKLGQPHQAPVQGREAINGLHRQQQQQQQQPQTQPLTPVGHTTPLNRGGHSAVLPNSNTNIHPHQHGVQMQFGTALQQRPGSHVAAATAAAAAAAQTVVARQGGSYVAAAPRTSWTRSQNGVARQVPQTAETSQQGHNMALTRSQPTIAASGIPDTAAPAPAPAPATTIPPAAAAAVAAAAAGAGASSGVGVAVVGTAPATAPATHWPGGIRMPPQSAQPQMTTARGMAVPIGSQGKSPTQGR